MADKTGIEWTEATATKRCSACKACKPYAYFARDRSRPDGLTYWYRPTPRPSAGRRFVDPRADDRKQARRRVNHLVDIGALPAPNTVSCADCGHVWRLGERRHEYDHHLGYAPDHHEDVQAVCTSCHHQRENQRRAA